MDTFDEALKNAPVISAALRTLAPTEKHVGALVELYEAGVEGIEIDLDSRNRLHGPTIYHLSRIGTALTRQLGVGPRDGVMWFGTVREQRDKLFWVMRPQMRAALERLDWVTPQAPNPPDIEEDFAAEYEAVEGGQYLVTHLQRERDPQLREIKRNAARLADGSLECEACGANSKAVFPGVGGLNWDVHHRVALSEGSSRSTRIEDLAVLCPTCHRGIHCIVPMPTVEQFRMVFFNAEAVSQNAEGRRRSTT